MLRLKPSELMLTPEDVDETWHRMTRRQQARASAATAQRRSRQGGRSPAPRLLPGAQRSVSDAITHPSNISATRVQPQQAGIAHVDDDSKDSAELPGEPSSRAESSPDLINLLTRSAQSPNHPPATVAAPARHSARLPFRLGRPRRRSEVHQEPAISSSGQSNISEQPPQTQTIDTTEVPFPVTPRRDGPNDSTLTYSSSTLLQSEPSEAPASLRGGASHRRTGDRFIGQESPFHQTQLPGSSHPPENDPLSPDEEPQVRYLRGYFASNTDRYTFEELVSIVPSTEPSYKTRQRQLRQRSYSSSDAPPSRLFNPDAHSQQAFRFDDIIWTATLPTNEQTANTFGERPRQHSSDVSNASLAYSVYQLPESRQSSGEQQVQKALFQSQYDGAVSSRHDSHGTYHSVRMSDAQALADSVNYPSMPSRSSFAPALSASLTNSDARIPGSHASSQPITHPGVGQNNHSTHGGSTISTAVINRDSPLGTLAAHTAREAQRLDDRQGYNTQQSAQFGSAHPTFYNPSNRWASRNPSHMTHGSPRNAGLTGGAFHAPMAMADDPYTRGVSAHTEHRYGMVTQPPPPQLIHASGYANTPYSRSTQSVRSNRRSSENAPVGFAVHTGQPSRNSQVREQVSAFEQMHNAAQSR